MIDALLVQDPYRMGYDGIKTALAASKGEKVDSHRRYRRQLVTKANMERQEHRAVPEGQDLHVAASRTPPRRLTMRRSRLPAVLGAQATMSIPMRIGRGADAGSRRQ